MPRFGNRGRNNVDYLFRRVDSHSQREGQRAAMIDAIARLDGNRVLSTSLDDLAQYFAAEHSVQVPVLLADRMSVSQSEAQIDVSRDSMRHIPDRSRPFMMAGTKVTVEVPFEGEREVFSIRPSAFDSMPPRGEVKASHLVFEVTGTNLATDSVRQEIDRWLNSVEKYLHNLRKDYDAFNAQMETAAREQIEQRRTKLLADQNLVAGLGIPLKERPDAPKTYVAPEVRRKVLPAPPPATSGTFKPEPVLEEAEYQRILGIMQNMVHVMERSPKAFHELGEEDIRSHFLVQLNGQYEGNATGETFNYEGKTDILVRSEGRNIFVGECKVWGGPQVLTETIDQILGYLTWRDAKAAILLFNRNRDLSRVLSAISPTVEAHPNFRKSEEQPTETAFRYRFRHKDDAAKDVVLTILVFDIPSPA
jgi:hypothetical protein